VIERLVSEQTGNVLRSGMMVTLRLPKLVVFLAVNAGSRITRTADGSAELEGSCEEVGAECRCVHAPLVTRMVNLARRTSLAPSVAIVFANSDAPERDVLNVTRA
jgi:hypothetical protein